MPAVDWDQVLWTVPIQDILKAAAGPRGIFADAMPVPTGGAMVKPPTRRTRSSTTP